MSDLRKAAEMALAKLDHLWEIGIDAEYKVELLPEIHALRQALAQPEWVCCVCGEPEALGVVHGADSPCFHYTKREWVGLTESEIVEIAGGGITRDERMIARAIEAKLKEKNT